MGCCGAKPVEGKLLTNERPTKKVHTAEGKEVARSDRSPSVSPASSVIGPATDGRARQLLEQKLDVLLATYSKFQKAFTTWHRVQKANVEACWKTPSQHGSITRVKKLIAAGLFDDASPRSTTAQTISEAPQTIEWESASDITSSDESAVQIVQGKSAVYEPEKADLQKRRLSTTREMRGSTLERRKQSLLK